MVDLPDDNREAAINAITLPEVNSIVEMKNIFKSYEIFRIPIVKNTTKFQAEIYLKIKHNIKFTYIPLVT